MKDDINYEVVKVDNILAQRNTRVFKEIIVEYPFYYIYPEYEGKPYFSIKYTENGQEFIGYGTYKPEVLSEYLKKYFMPQWIPCTPETMPEKDGRYVCTYTYDGKKDVFMFRFEDGDFLVPWYVDTITAWYKPLDPWEGDTNG